MKFKGSICVQVIVLLTTLSLPVGLAAQNKEDHNKHHHHYQLIDLGTFGGPQSWVFGGFEAPVAALNNAGTVTGTANTPDSNPNYSYPCNPFGSFSCSFFGTPDPFVEQAFQFKNGVLTDLGVLPGGYSSFGIWISANGLVTGNSENGVIDPLVGVPEVRAVLWNNVQPTDLGTFGGNESMALAVNNHGQVAGGATNTVPDAFSGFGTQGRAFLWQNGVKRDLGSLGTGTDALATLVNEHGQVAGAAFTNTIIDPNTGIPNQDPFFWQDDGKGMQDIGSFGGGLGFPNAINNRGQVVGQSNLAGDQSWHGFLWESGVLTDLPSLGGCCSGARWISESGDIVGYAYDGDQFNLAVLWRDGKVHDVIGTVDGDACAVAQSINSAGQVVGLSDAACDGTVLHAFLWEDDGPPVDLDTLIAPGSGLQLTQAVSINDRGEIAGQATTSAGDNHAFLLIPCDEHHRSVEGCDYSLVEGIVATDRSHPSTHEAVVPARPAFTTRRGYRFHTPGGAVGPRN
jgi:probable HAF family extracellular repeat protein